MLFAGEQDRMIHFTRVIGKEKRTLSCWVCYNHREQESMGRCRTSLYPLAFLVERNAKARIPPAVLQQADAALFTAPTAATHPLHQKNARSVSRPSLREVGGADVVVDVVGAEVVL
jgi:hypothetical protein